MITHTNALGLFAQAVGNYKPYQLPELISGAI